MNQLIRCVKCGEVFLQTPFDRWPEYGPSQDASTESFQVLPKDDFGDFLRNHRGHRLEDLKIVEDSFVSEKDYTEPIKTSYFKATNGRDNFLIKRFRERIDEPSKYELIPGDLLMKCAGIEIQAKEIERQMEKELLLPKQKIAAFIRLYRRIAEEMDVEQLERVPEESSNPLEVYYRMDDVSLAFLFRNCRTLFKGQQYQDIERFIESHKEDSVLLLKARFLIQISTKGRARTKVVPPALQVEARKNLKKEEP